MHAQEDQEYVYAFQDTMNLKLLLANRGLNTVLYHRDTGENIPLNPNQLGFIGIGAYFWDFSLKLYLPLPLSWFFDQAKFQQSKVFDFQASLYKNNWLLEGTFQRYQNLYPWDGQLSANRLGQEIPHKLLARKIMAHATYLFSGEQVSVKSAFGRNVVQTQSAGSWILTTGFTSLELGGNSSLLPAEARSSLGSDSLVSEMSTAAIVLRPGYAYNFVFKNFFLHTSASAGLALQYKLYKVEQRRSSDWGLAPTLDFRTALGYDNGRYFTGISAALYYDQLRVRRLEMRQSTRNLQFFLGYRFAEPDWLRRLKPSFLK